MTQGKWAFGDGVFGEKRGDPAVPRIKFGFNDIVDGWHEHGSVTHHHEEGNEKHKHTTHDMRTESDGTLVADPRRNA